MRPYKSLIIKEKRNLYIAMRPTNGRLLALVTQLRRGKLICAFTHQLPNIFRKAETFIDSSGAFLCKHLVLPRAISHQNSIGRNLQSRLLAAPTYC